MIALGVGDSLGRDVGLVKMVVRREHRPSSGRVGVVHIIRLCFKFQI
jgi:hypothetical protein